VSDKLKIVDDLLNIKDLPSPPQVALKVLEVSQDPEQGLSMLAKVLEVDPALTAKVMQISNSAAYSRGRGIATLTDAISLLGGKSIGIIALSFTLKNSLPAFRHDGLTDSLLWRHSVATGVACRSLSRLVRFPSHETAFMCGMMSRIGQLVLLSLCPDRYAPAVLTAQGLLPSASEERDVLGVTHHQVGRLLLDKWRLPTMVCDVVERWGTFESATDRRQDTNVLIAMVQVADALRGLLFEEDKAKGLESVHVLSAKLLGVAGGEIDRLFIGCQQELEETLRVFDEQPTEKLDCQRILESAREQLVQVGLQLAANLSAAEHTAESLEVSNRELKKKSATDALTRLPNRAALDEELLGLNEVGRNSGAVDRVYSIVMIDVDNFKLFNDTHGHVAGDQVLQSVAAALAESARNTDFVARYGGEEFTVILTSCGLSEAMTVAERFRRSIETRGIELRDKTLFVTASFGVASSENFPKGTLYQEILKCADTALYHAKKQGRNRVVKHSPTVTAALGRE
jgi:diguanylate cyclase (GGDEF)-like protein